MTRPWWLRPVRLVVCAYLLYGFVDGILGAARDRDLTGAVVVGALQLVGTACWLVALRRPTGTLTLLAVVAALGLLAHWYVPYAGYFLLFAVAWLTPFRARLGPTLLLGAAVTGGFVAVSTLVELPGPAIFGISAGLGWSVYFGLVLNQLATTKRQSAAVASARASEAVLAERQRLAREIHDLLAHALAAQVVHLEGTRLLLANGGDRQQAAERVRQAGDLAGPAWRKPDGPSPRCAGTTGHWPRSWPGWSRTSEPPQAIRAS